jgi:hypothetical protein
MARSSPPSKPDSNTSERRAQAPGPLSDKEDARRHESGSPLAHRTQRGTRVEPKSSKGNELPGGLPDTPTSYNSAEYVMVDRPHNSRHQDEDEDDEDDDEDDE